ncbi:CGNR zinc finger domain-containing protein [Kitasatospora sp. NPDC096147]|uniref:CGNR zinc finger domain-containing protein n=1 Tax=Kitasatospora sp. NPDC096147 TaxID=3364093 RepID=UPI00381707B5
MSSTTRQRSSTPTAVDRLPLTGEPLALDLVNTTYVHGGTRGSLVDALTGPADLDDWLRACLPRLGARLRPELARLLDRQPADSDHLARLLELRAALRELSAARVSEAAPPPAALDTVNRTARLAAGWLEFAPGGTGTAPRWTEPDLRLVALGEIAAAGVELLTGPAAEQLRACRAPGCILYFVRSHARREWCTTACGNRVRVARHSKRLREPAAPTP